MLVKKDLLQEHKPMTVGFLLNVVLASRQQTIQLTN